MDRSATPVLPAREPLATGPTEISLSDFKDQFIFGLTDNPFYAVAIPHDKGTYLLVNTQNRPHAQEPSYPLGPYPQDPRTLTKFNISELVDRYLFDFIPQAYSSFGGERTIDSATLDSGDRKSLKRCLQLAPLVPTPTNATSPSTRSFTKSYRRTLRRS